MANTKRVSQFLKDIAVKAPWGSRYGTMRDLGASVDTSYDNNFARKYMTADGQNDVEIYRVDPDNNIRIGQEAINPARTSINFPLTTNASIVTQTFFIAPFAMVVSGVSCEFETADGAANTATVTHETGTQSAGTGVAIHVGTFNLNATAKTVQNAVLPVPFPSSGSSTPLPGAINLAKGDRLSFKIASAVTSLAGLVISIAAAPAAKGHIAVYNMQANGDLLTQTFFVANRPQTIQSAQVIWGTKSSSGTSTIDITKDVSTNAPGAGTSILTATVDATAAANTVTTPALTATPATLTMAAGDRLSVKFGGAGQVALAGVVVVVWFTPVYSRKEVTFTLAKTANLVTQPFFICDQDYVVCDISEVHATAGTDGGAVTAAVTIDNGTTAAGGGGAAQTDNSSAGFSLKTTANTVQFATLAAPRLLIAPKGSRLSIKFAGVTTSLAGMSVTVSMWPW